MVDVRAVALKLSIRAGDITIGGIGLQNIWIRSRNRVKERLVHAKVLGKDILRSMSDPIIDVECGADELISV